MKLVEVQAAMEFAEAFLPDIFLKMAVNLVHCKECKHQGRCEIESLLLYGTNELYCSDGERKDNGKA